jgi:GNAT superfamily N-acetyltransferase
MDGVEIVALNPDNIGSYGVCGYKDIKKYAELQRKIQWMQTFQPKGLTIKVVDVVDGGTQGMIEYIPGEYAHRPVSAEGYMFIHCLFVGFKKEYKGKGLATMLLNECVRDAREQGMSGVAVVTRKGSFMADNPLFLRNGFHVVDRATPDFELSVLKFETDKPNPAFNPALENRPAAYSDGLTIFRSAQCPYSVKNVDAILASAEKMHIPARLIEIEDAQTAQQVPSPFGTFCIVYRGKIIAYHPISHTRFMNIMQKM